MQRHRESRLADIGILFFHSGGSDERVITGIKGLLRLQPIDSVRVYNGD